MNPERRESRVLLISLPFYSAFASCYQIELLAEILRPQGFRVETFHGNYAFGAGMEQLGQLRLYKKLISIRYFGDYLHLARMFPERAGEIFEEMRRTVPESNDFFLDDFKSFFSCINRINDELLERCARFNPFAVGFSSTHYQLIPSLLCAKLLKQRFPEIRTLLGGYLSSPDTARDILERQDCIDWVVYGEADRVLGPLLRDLLDQKRPARGLLRGQRNLKLTAIPRYDAFIAQGPASRDHTPYIAFNFELSRGCYWDKCTFCNFNSGYGRFRRFSPDAVIAEMDRLHADHGVSRFQFLDTSLPPAFADFVLSNNLLRPGYDVFCEIMVDFDKRKLKALHDFGVRRTQVGIESFSTDHLRTMNKAADLIDNVVFLKNCKAIGVEPLYGLMVKVPGETEHHLKETIDVMCNLGHLHPPKYISYFDLRPESPAFAERDRYGLKIEIRPGIFDSVLPARDHNCELRPSRVEHQCDRESGHGTLISRMTELMESWRTDWSGRSPSLLLYREDGLWTIEDGRKLPARKTRVPETVARILISAEERISIDQLQTLGTGIDQKLAECRARGWAILDGHEFVALTEHPKGKRPGHRRDPEDLKNQAAADVSA